MSFSQALSGLNAAKEKLGVIGNNIANSQTVGFKGATTQFADVFANAQVGLGTRVAAVLQNFSTGNIENTSRGLDLAIAGDGFYRFQGTGGEVLYSRNGQLSMTADGYLVNAQGARIMGYGLANPNDAFSAVAAGGQPVAIQIPADGMPARATGSDTGVQAIYNLDAGIDLADASLLNQAEVRTSNPGVVPEVTQNLNYHYANSFSVYDSLGNSRTISAYFEKTADNAWTVRTAVDGYYDPANDFDLDFTTSGVLQTDAAGNIIGVGGAAAAPLSFNAALLGGGVADLAFDFNLRGTTQFAGNSTQNALVQDGYPPGDLIGISIESDGTVLRNYSNEQSVAAGQIVLANFRNPEGLKAVGDNAWTTTLTSGNEVLGAPGSGMLGSLQAGAVESSNVDMAAELVEMIVTQRAYQANSQTIKTQDELLQTMMNLR